MKIDEVTDCRSNFGRFLASTPNEKGDTLAGIAGSLAFLWIIITVLLQGKELSLQKDEIEKMRITQEKQTDLLLKQSTQMEQSKVDDQIKALVDHLEDLLPKLGFHHWQVGTTEKDSFSVAFVRSNWKLPEDHDAFSWWKDTIESVSAKVLQRVEGNTRVLTPKLPASWIAAEEAASDTLKLYGQASPKQKIWLDKTIQIREFHALISDCVANENLWKS